MTENKDIIKLIREKDMLAKKLGIEIVEAADGRSHVTMMLDETVANGVGNAHGGTIFSLADLAFATACNSEGILSVSIEANIHYMAPCICEGRLDAFGEKVSETKSLGFYKIRVVRPSDDKLIAEINAIAFKKG